MDPIVTATLISVGASMLNKMMDKGSSSSSGRQTTKVEPYGGEMPDPDQLWSNTLGEFFGYDPEDVADLERRRTAIQEQIKDKNISKWKRVKKGEEWEDILIEPDPAEFASLQNELDNIDSQLATAREGIGKPGLQEKLTGQEDWLNEKYGGYLGDIEKAGGIRETGLLDALTPYKEAMENKLGLSFGGEPVTSFVTRPDREVAESIFSKDLMLPELQAGNIENLGGMRWAGESERPLHGADLKYLTALMGLSQQDLATRFGLPSQTQTGFLQGPEASFLTQLGTAANTGTSLMDLYDRLKISPPPSSNVSTIQGGEGGGYGF